MSVAQAAMIGNPVSMPRVVYLADKYNQTAGKESVFVVQVTEQAIMDWTLLANRNGHIACTHGGESLAGLRVAIERGIVDKTDTAIIDSTAHALKFAGFTDMYFQHAMPPEFGVTSKSELINTPSLIHPKDLSAVPAPGKPLSGDAFDRFVRRVTEEIASELQLRKGET